MSLLARSLINSLQCYHKFGSISTPIHCQSTRAGFITVYYFDGKGVSMSKWLKFVMFFQCAYFCNIITFGTSLLLSPIYIAKGLVYEGIHQCNLKEKGRRLCKQQDDNGVVSLSWLSMVGTYFIILIAVCG